MEDDVDWDIHLRTSQVPLAAAAVRQLIAAQSVSPGKTKYETELTSYWGNSSMWDILYLGHCGDRFNSSNWKFQIPNVMYEDMTLPPRVEMHPYTQSFLESISIPEYTRLIHQSVFPLCTFGYALTRNAAQRLITDVAVRGSDGGTTAYDVRILEACRDLGFRCWSANPELFHHLGIDSEIAIMNGAGGEDERTNEDGSGWMSYSRISHAPNIACGVRSHKSSTRNRHALDFLRGVDGRLQECLDSGRDDRMASSSVR
ncbi:glycosyltransferase family 25 protein [Acidomyces richmondensis BFW]|nr:MAG: glycosyltransferase family 25 protein [Acidomyces sp. 'richmondensis']KYG49597.1 glycosyltransferase family 25 protein [Acidomyces richmondensis BFW]